MKQISIDVEVSRVIESNRNAFSESENDILRRMLLGQHFSAQKKTNAPIPQQQGTRRRGEWSLVFEGSEIAAANMIDAYCKMLLKLSERDPNFLRNFSQLKSRSRRYVARDPRTLYISSPHLAKDFARELTPDWFVDLNLSEQQVGQRVRDAAEVVDLRYGHQIRLLKSGRTI
jgi:negative regulator of replication initiation